MLTWCHVTGRNALTAQTMLYKYTPRLSQNTRALSMAMQKQSTTTQLSMMAFILLSLFLSELWVRLVSGCRGSTIGIDLGMTDSCAGVYDGNGQAKIIPNDQGTKTMPSCVAFTDKGVLVGEKAKDQATTNPEGTIVDIQRFIGKTFDDPEVQEEINKCPYTVVEQEGKPCVEVNVTGEMKVISPEEITAMIVGKLRETAEACLGHPVKNAVVTVPAGFDEEQIQATKDACTLARLNVTAVINEPTAAAIAYGLDKKTGEKNVLVYNLGGSTFDASILSVKNGTIETLASSGDAHLGGQDFDKNVMDYFIKVVKKKCGVDITNDTVACRKLLKECEKASKALSCHHEARIKIKSLVDGIDFCLTLTRKRFESLNADLFNKTMDCVTTALDDAGLTKTDIDETILAGGCAKMPKTEELLTDFCDGQAPMKEINPAVVVGCGAAIEAGTLGGEGGEDAHDILRILSKLETAVKHKDMLADKIDSDGNDECVEIMLEDI